MAKAKEGRIRNDDLYVKDCEHLPLPHEGQLDRNIYEDSVVEVALQSGLGTTVLKNVVDFDNSNCKAVNANFRLVIRPVHRPNAVHGPLVVDLVLICF